MCTFESFLPSVVGLIAKKQVDDTTPIETELRAFAAVAFRDTVMHFARESKQLRSEVGIDFYANNTFYPIAAPKGFIITGIEAVKDNSGLANPPAFTLGPNSLTLTSCPEKNIDRALFVEVSMIPTFDSEVCELPEVFCTQYRQEILDGMVSRLAGQKSQSWYDLDLSRQALGQYNAGVKEAKTELVHRHADESKGNANKFLSAILTGLTQDDSNITLEESEVLSAVNTVFRDTVIDISRETGLYRMEVALGLYSNTNRYPITPPEKHHLRDVVDVKVLDITPHTIARDSKESKKAEIAHVKSFLNDSGQKYHFACHPETGCHMPTKTCGKPKHRPHPMRGMGKMRVIDDVIWFDRPPCEDIDRALMVEVSLIPHHDVCEFDNEFVDRYYEMILKGMLMRLSRQGGKQWGRLGVYRDLRKEYQDEMSKAKRRNHGQPVKFKSHSLTSQA